MYFVFDPQLHIEWERNGFFYSCNHSTGNPTQQRYELKGDDNDALQKVMSANQLFHAYHAQTIRLSSQMILVFTFISHLVQMIAAPSA